MRNILYLSYDGMTDPLGQSQVLPYLLGLSKKGHKIILISFEKHARLKARRTNILSSISDSKIQWKPLVYHKSPPVLSTLYDLIILRKVVKQILQKENIDVLHCRSYLTVLIGLHLKEKYGVKVLFDMRGFWADERIEGGIWDMKNPLFRVIYRYFKRKEKFFWKNSDYLVSLTQSAKQYIESKERNHAPIEVIPCCVDLAFFDPKVVKLNKKKVLSLKEKLGITNDDFVLLYLGSLGTWYMLDEMVDFFKVLLEYKPNAKFLFITKDKPDCIITTAEKKGILPHQIIVTGSERDELPFYMTLVQLSVFFINPVFSKKASSPTKQGELMSMGIPIICNAGVGDTAEIIQNTSAGAVIADFSEINYRLVCKQITHFLSVKPEVIQTGAKDYYSLEKGVENYHQIYEKLG
ncbi:glycosyltransferase [Catalinimonas sp. 4WD22]|uniref:glycosyltransferase n=1 Tax=Catalinimonas locisalis TaxID=3133978 RepID=UPI003100D50D